MLLSLAVTAAEIPSHRYAPSLPPPGYLPGHLALTASPSPVVSATSAPDILPRAASTAPSRMSTKLAPHIDLRSQFARSGVHTTPPRSFSHHEITPFHHRPRGTLPASTFSREPRLPRRARVATRSPRVRCQTLISGDTERSDRSRHPTSGATIRTRQSPPVRRLRRTPEPTLAHRTRFPPTSHCRCSIALTAIDSCPHRVSMVGIGRRILEIRRPRHSRHDRAGDTSV